MLKNLKKGDWIFTCKMDPVQFSHYQDTDSNNDPFDVFFSIEGSVHSQRHCGCKRISKEYAEWFIDNEISKLFDKYEDKENAFILYEKEVKLLCEEKGIQFEGI